MVSLHIAVLLACALVRTHGFTDANVNKNELNSSKAEYEALGANVSPHVSGTEGLPCPAGAEAVSNIEVGKEEIKNSKAKPAKANVGSKSKVEDSKASEKQDKAAQTRVKHAKQGSNPTQKKVTRQKAEDEKPTQVAHAKEENKASPKKAGLLEVEKLQEVLASQEKLAVNEKLHTSEVMEMMLESQKQLSSSQEKLVDTEKQLLDYYMHTDSKPSHVNTEENAMATEKQHVENSKSSLSESESATEAQTEKTPVADSKPTSAGDATAPATKPAGDVTAPATTPKAQVQTQPQASVQAPLACPKDGTKAVIPNAKGDCECNSGWQCYDERKKSVLKEISKEETDKDKKDQLEKFADEENSMPGCANEEKEVNKVVFSAQCKHCICKKLDAESHAQSWQVGSLRTLLLPVLIAIASGC